MTTHIITHKSCDGCGRNEADGIINIVESELRYPNVPSAGTVDLCETCAEAGLYICRWCRKVHGDENPCIFVVNM